MSSSERLVVVGGLGLAVASLVPWYKADEFSFGIDATRTNGWQEPDAVLSIVGTIAGAALALVVLAAGRGRDRPVVGTLSWGTLLTGVSAAAFGLIALKFSLNTDNTTVGVYLALTAAVTQLYGAYVTRVEEPASVPAPEPSAPRPPPPPTTSPVAAPAPTVPATGATAPARPATAPYPSDPAARPDPRWPETGYFLAAWLRPGGDVATATAAYRRAFANDVARQVRLVGELRSLLEPGRPDAERSALVVTHAPHVPPGDAAAVLTSMLQGLMQPGP